MIEGDGQVDTQDRDSAAEAPAEASSQPQPASAITLDDNAELELRGRVTVLEDRVERLETITGLSTFLLIALAALVIGPRLLNALKAARA